MSELIPHNEQTPKQPTAIETWASKENGLTVAVKGIHLGRVEREDGGADYKDDASTLVTEAGLIFTVTQNSAGLTRTSVAPIEGYVASALALDPKTEQPFWKEASPHSGEVVVSADYGTLVEDDSDAATKPWNADTVFGNPGVHAGVVRVVGPENETRYFGFAADFGGNADDWNVDAQLGEVFPINALEVPDQQIES